MVPISGFGSAGCVDITGGPEVITGLVVGDGTFYVATALDDFNVEAFSAGSLTSAVFAGQSAVLNDEVTFAPTQYAATVQAPLRTVVPGSPPIVGYSCPSN